MVIDNSTSIVEKCEIMVFIIIFSALFSQILHLPILGYLRLFNVINSRLTKKKRGKMKEKWKNMHGFREKFVSLKPILKTIWKSMIIFSNVGVGPVPACKVGLGFMPAHKNAEKWVYRVSAHFLSRQTKRGARNDINFYSHVDYKQIKEPKTQ